MSNKRAERLKNAIQESGMSMAKISELSGIPQPSISRYASGATENIPVDSIPKLAHALSISPYYLLCWDDEADRPLTAEERRVVTKYLETMHSFDERGYGPDRLMELLDFLENFSGPPNKRGNKK